MAKLIARLADRALGWLALGATLACWAALALLVLLAFVPVWLVLAGFALVFAFMGLALTASILAGLRPGRVSWRGREIGWRLIGGGVARGLRDFVEFRIGITGVRASAAGVRRLCPGVRADRAGADDEHRERGAKP